MCIITYLNVLLCSVSYSFLLLFFFFVFSFGKSSYHLTMQAAFANTILQIMIECILHAIPCNEHTWTNEPNSCVFSKMYSVRGRTGHERTWIDKIADRRSPNRPPAHSNTHNFALFVVSDIKMQSALCGSLFLLFLLCACVCMSVCPSIYCMIASVMMIINFYIL